MLSSESLFTVYFVPGIVHVGTPRDGGAWWAAAHGVAKSRARLSDFPFTFHLHALEKEVATPSSVLAWRVPGTEEPSGLPSRGRQSWTQLSDSAAAAEHMLPSNP